MPHEVIMPKLAMTQETGTILQWYKAEGEPVEPGEPLLEVMTNKINIDVESYKEGILLKRLYDEGAQVPVLEVIAYIGQPEEKIPEQLATAPQIEKLSEFTCVKESEIYDRRKVRATPAARALARAHHIDLNEVTGTGNRGRIHKEDVQAHMERRKASVIASPAERRTLEPIKQSQISPQSERINTSQHRYPQDTTVKLTGIRKIIGERMAQSAFNAPHVTLCLEVDMLEASTLRQQMMPIVEQQTESRFSMNVIILRAVASALRKHSNVNATWSGENELTYHASVHLGMAVAVQSGLLVPVIHEADRIGFSELTTVTKQLADEARGRTLSPDALIGGTFTVSNLGMYGIEEFTPIINSPQVAILGVGCIIDKPCAVNGQVVIRPRMKLSISFDHRALDGAEAAAFLQDVKKILETPMLLLF